MFAQLELDDAFMEWEKKSSYNDATAYLFAKCDL